MNKLPLKFTRRTKEERLEQLYDVLLGQGAPLTVTQIARRIGMSKSTYVFKMLDELVLDGDALKFVFHSARHLPTLYYAVCDRRTGAPSVNEQGSVLTQMLPGDGDTWYSDGAQTWSNAIEDILPF